MGIPDLDDPVQIGRGGFSTVYRARQRRFSREVAVKVLREPVTDPGVKERFELECQVMGSVSGHPRIVTIYDAGLTMADRPYFVLDYMARGSLADRVRERGPMP